MAREIAESYPDRAKRKDPRARRPTSTALTTTPAAEEHAGLTPTVLPADRHPVALYLASLPSHHSRRAMARDLNIIADTLTAGRQDAQTLNWGALRFQHTRALTGKLGEQYAFTSVNHMLSALRGVLKACRRLRLISAEDYTDAIDVRSIKGATLPKGRALSQGEIRALFTVCHEDRSCLGRRDSALLAVLFSGGLRRSELVGLEVDHYDPDTGALTVRSGKGRKDRVVYMVEGAARALRAWLEVRGEAEGPLFVRIRKGGHMTTARLTDQAVLCIVDRRRQQAGISHFSPHDARRTYITTLFAGGADGATIQRLAGHEDIKTSARYDRRGDKALKDASALIHIPYGE